MIEQDYHATIIAKITAEEAFENIGRVSAWWTKSCEGSSKSTGDIFTVSFGETFVNFTIAEVVPGKKIVWKVTDCNLHWLKDKKEWKDTRISWEVSTGNNSTQINFTHIGLVSGMECYHDCVKGWNFYVKESLFKLMTGHKGLPETPRRSR